MFTRLDCRDSRFRHTCILKSWDCVCFTVSKLFLESKLYKELLSTNIMLQATVSVKNITCHKWNSKVGSLFDLIPSQSNYPFVCFFLNYYYLSHPVQFSNISNLLQKDIPVIFLFFCLYPLSYFFFLFCFDQNMLISYGFTRYP